MPSQEQIKRVADDIAKRFADKGQLIQAGWAAYRMLVLPPMAPPMQVDECRIAFMAGAQHLFGSIMGIMDPGTEPTEADLRKMDLIEKELRAFELEMRTRMPPPGTHPFTDANGPGE
jgi:hypothetical protein